MPSAEFSGVGLAASGLPTLPSSKGLPAECDAVIPTVLQSVRFQVIFAVVVPVFASEGARRSARGCDNALSNVPSWKAVCDTPNVSPGASANAAELHTAVADSAKAFSDDAAGNSSVRGAQPGDCPN